MRTGKTRELDSRARHGIEFTNKAGICMQTVEIFEVGPRDGLQPEPVFVETGKKIELVNRLTEAG